MIQENYKIISYSIQSNQFVSFKKEKEKDDLPGCCLLKK